MTEKLCYMRVQLIFKFVIITYYTFSFAGMKQKRCITNIVNHATCINLRFLRRHLHFFDSHLQARNVEMEVYEIEINTFYFLPPKLSWKKFQFWKVTEIRFYSTLNNAHLQAENAVPFMPANGDFTYISNELLIHRHEKLYHFMPGNGS